MRTSSSRSEVASGRLIGAINMLIDSPERKQADETLRESEERVRVLADEAPALIWMNGLEGCECVNREYVEFVGANVRDVMGYNWSRYIHPDDRLGYLQAYVDAADERRIFAAEFRLRRHDGEYRWMRSSARPRFGACGAFLGYAGLTVDITDRKLIEDALRAQTHRLDILNRVAMTFSEKLDLEPLIQRITDLATQLSGANFGAFFHNVVDSDGERSTLFTLSGAPRAAFEKFGLPRNTPVFDPTLRGAAVVRSDDIRRDPRYGRNAPHHGIPAGHLPVVSYLAVPVISRSGTVHGGLFLGHPEPGVFTQDSEDLVTGLAAHAAIAIGNAHLLQEARREAPERRRAEVAAEQLASIVENSEDAIVSVDLDGRITSWNGGAQHLYGYAAHEIIGRPSTTLIPPERHDEEPAILARIRCGERVEPYETVRQRRDGTSIDVSLTVSPVRNEQGDIVGASKIARDITDRKRAHQNQILLIGEMRHRIKNTLATVQAIAAQTLKGTAPDQLAAFRSRLNALAGAHDLLTPDNWNRASISEAVGHALKPFQDSRHERLIVEGPDGALDAQRSLMLTLALHELATNAVKYGALSNGTGHVRLSWNIDRTVKPCKLRLRWQENGGPPVTFPARKGFGSRLMEQVMGTQTGGARLEFAPRGLVCNFELILNQASE